MYKLTFFFALFATFAGGIGCVHAQRNTTERSVSTSQTQLVGVAETFEHIEAFKLESGHEMLITPLVGSVKVLPNNNDGRTFEHKVFTGSARLSIPEGLASNEYLANKLTDGNRITAIDIEMLKAEVIYDFCRETGADLIVAPQFKIHHRTEPMAVKDKNGNDTTIDVPVERNDRYVMIVEAVGFPAIYSGFRDGTKEDGWIKDLFRDGQIDNETGNIVSDGETLIKLK